MNSPFDWSRMRAFLATAETGSLSAAARAIGLTQPTLGRQIAALEDELGLMLFERVGRGLHLTAAGQELLVHARDMGAAADRLALAAMGQSQSVEGTVRITASDMFSALWLPAVVSRCRVLAPRLHIDVIAVNDIRDLMRREADIAVRHVRPDQPDLVARLIREAQAMLYAAKSYLDARVRPQSLADLAQHDFISFGNVDRMVSYLNTIDIPVTAQNFRVNSENGLVAWAMARAGLGLCPMDDAVAAMAPEMECVLPQMKPITFPVWLTTHREIHTSPRIRLVFDVLDEILSKDLPPNATPSRT
ncbi:LysR family transcriptional regulator [Loktanella agnita]|uniref:LysR family transcriptional regulator n=1 Tax=Loktanella agnita TaxID=287097 RepID=UPI003988D8EC